MYELKQGENFSSSNVLAISRHKFLESQLFNIASGLDKHAETIPGGIAFIESTKSDLKVTTFKELQEYVNSKANFLRSSGIKKKDVVLVLEPQSFELFVSILAIFKLGATAMFVDPSMDKKVLDYCIKQVNPKAVVMTFKAIFLSALHKSIREIPIKIVDQCWFSKFGKSDANRVSDQLSSVPVKSTQIALITFTSGSSGKPKAIARSHGFLKNQLDILSKELKVKNDQIELTGLPMFVLANIANGVSTVLSKAKLSSPGKACGRTLIEESLHSGTTSLLGSPSLIDNIATEAIKTNRLLPQIQKVLTGGGTVSLCLLEKIKQVCPNASIITVYGSSEAEPICHQNFNQTKSQEKAITENGGGILVGKPIDSIELKIIGLTTIHKKNQEICNHIRKLHHDSSIVFGEILVTGKHVVKHYYKNIGDSKNKVVIDGKIWHRTSDIGYIDSQGRLWLTGAKPKNDIDTSYSFCIEQALHKIIDCNRSAFIAENKKRSLYISKLNKQTKINESFVLRSLSWAKIDEIKHVKNLPVDNRHNTKVLYDKLKRKSPV